MSETPSQVAPAEAVEVVILPRASVLEWIETLDFIGAHEMADELKTAVKDAARPTHRHLKRGSTYRVAFRDVEVQSARPIVEGDRLVIYVAGKRQVWARLVEEFDDGRFEAIEGEPTP